MEAEWISMAEPLLEQEFGEIKGLLAEAGWENESVNEDAVVVSEKQTELGYPLSKSVYPVQ